MVSLYFCSLFGFDVSPRQLYAESVSIQQIFSYTDVHETHTSMELCINTLTGVSLNILVSPFDTVYDVKYRIQKQEGLLIAWEYFPYFLVYH